MVGGEDVKAVEVVEDVDETSSVPVVRHSATIVDVAGSVHQHLWTTYQYTITELFTKQMVE